jgi:putative transposase
MPWTKTTPVNERLKFVAAHQAERVTMTELCRRFGVSRRTGYKILARYREEGPEGLRDQSRAPKTHPNQTSPDTESAILLVRKAHPTWGSKKIITVLARSMVEEDLPARSTIDAVLKRAGVVVSRKRRRRKQPAAPPVVEAHNPNDVWSMDYKGWFKVGDGTRCDPLTVNDVCSRVSLECRAMVGPKLEDVRKRLEIMFWQFGLPSYMLSDNGPPFASSGLGRLSRLGVWLLRLGVQPVYIQPGRPDQNGRHERFHETLKAETANPPKSTIRAQQTAFDRFQLIYNEERPHEALDMQVPAKVYDLSQRRMPDTLPVHDYDEQVVVRRVRSDGSIRWAGKYVFVGQAMYSESIGLRQVEEDLWHVYLGPMRLGVLHGRSKTIVPLPSD